MYNTKLLRERQNSAQEAYKNYANHKPNENYTYTMEPHQLYTIPKICNSYLSIKPKHKQSHQGISGHHAVAPNATKTSSHKDRIISA